ncbi:Transcriptional regulator SlyA [Thalassocella blandensis]|nr:Transcriptional regulator SlyA [Thalassocella blandensis]
MINDINIWLERLTSLYNSQVRHAANTEGIRPVHAEILQYLSICNRYSNTAQALSEYLGQTKGSISQSVQLLEKDGLIERRQCSEDKRVTRLFLTPKAQAIAERIGKVLMPNLGEAKEANNALKSLLMDWQLTNQHKGFGQCQTCRYNSLLSDGTFQCGLTGESLSSDEVKLLCREHEFQVRS